MKDLLKMFLVGLLVLLLFRLVSVALPPMLVLVGGVAVLLFKVALIVAVGWAVLRLMDRPTRERA